MLFLCFYRLASVYYEKLVFNNDNAWDYVNEYIITTFRNSTEQQQPQNSTNNLEEMNSNKEIYNPNIPT